jgi:hypothetical protein
MILIELFPLALTVTTQYYPKTATNIDSFPQIFIRKQLLSIHISLRLSVRSLIIAGTKFIL